MIHRFVDLPETGTPIIPIMVNVDAPVSEIQIWTIGEGLPPFQLTTTGQLISNAAMGDPRLSPDETEIVHSYARNPAGTPFGQIYASAVDDSYNDLVESLSPFTANISMGQAWAPDGSYVVFCEPPPGVGTTKISKVNRDGTGYTVLYTLPAGLTNNLAFSPSGDYISFGVFRSGFPGELWVMEDDGSNPTKVYTSVNFEQTFTAGRQAAWKNGSDVLGFCDIFLGLGSPNLFRTINADGTGLTTIYSDTSRLYYGIHMHAWLSDDSAMVGFKRTNGTTVFNATEGVLATIDAAGGGPTDSAIDFGTAGIYKAPAVMQTTREAPRIYYTKILSGGTRRSVASVLEDFSGYRVDFDGDTENVGGAAVTQSFMYSTSL